MRSQDKPVIVVDQTKCRRCLICQLVCSLRYHQALNPAKARIQIGLPARNVDECTTEITFTDECNDCGLCAVYCVYGALKRQKKIQ